MAVGSQESSDRFIHDQRNALFVLRLMNDRTRSIAHAVRARAAETRLRAQGLHAVIRANLRRSALAQARTTAPVASQDTPPAGVDGDVAFEDARVVDEGLVLVVEIGGRRAGIPRQVLRPGTDVQLAGERGRLVISRQLARDQGLL